MTGLAVWIKTRSECLTSTCNTNPREGLNLPRLTFGFSGHQTCSDKPPHYIFLLTCHPGPFELPHEGAGTPRLKAERLERQPLAKLITHRRVNARTVHVVARPSVSRRNETLPALCTTSHYNRPYCNPDTSSREAWCHSCSQTKAPLLQALCFISVCGARAFTEKSQRCSANIIWELEREMKATQKCKPW